MSKPANRAHKIFWDVHAWTGVVAGLLLYIMFFTGAFALFRAELRDWSTLSASEVTGSQKRVEETTAPLLESRPDAAWLFELTDGGTSVIGGQIRSPGDREYFGVDRAGGFLPERTAVERILWRLHFFHQLPYGFYFSGFVGMALVLAIVTGVLIHWRNIPSQLMRFRPGKSLRIVWVDAHKVLGTIGLPFLLIFGLTGTFICLGPLLLESHAATTFKDDPEQGEELLGFVHAHVEAAGAPGPRLSYDELIERARAAVPGLVPEWIRFQHRGDANEVMNVYATHIDGEPFGHATALVRARDGEVLAVNAPASRGPAARATAAAFALHFVSYGGTALRLIQAILALAGCATILSGFAVWLSRREARAPRLGNRILLGFVIGTGAGLPLGTAALFATSRILPADLAWRVGWENVAIFGTWLAASLYAFSPLPHRRIIRDLLLGAGGLFAIAALLDLGAGLRWEAVGVNAALVAFSMSSVWVAARLHRQLRVPALAIQEG